MHAHDSNFALRFPAVGHIDSFFVRRFCAREQDACAARDSSVARRRAAGTRNVAGRSTADYCFFAEGTQTQTAVVVCPGGGYGMLAVDHEGKQIAQWLNNLGIAAFMLEYRLGPKYHHPSQLLDAQRAIRYVRSHAEEYHLDSRRIGIWGFSAGGHLAAMAGTMFDAGDAAAKDPIDRVSSRPDFLILDYALTDRLGSASDYSYGNLLGKNPDAKQLAEVTPVLHVTHETPTTFLVHSDDDEVVLPQNSINFYLALKKAGVPAELHIYRYGGHGYGLAPLDPVLSSYALRLADWLRGIGVL